VTEPAHDQDLIGCRGLLVGYQGRAILPPVELTIRRAELWAVIGRNGAGKTTWLRTLLGLLSPVAGEVRREISGLKLSYLAQRQSFDELYPLRARDVVAMGLQRGRSFSSLEKGGDAARIERALALVGASELVARPFRQLSEGQKQRVLFARVAASEPDLAILDEPTSAMDLVAEREALELLQRLRRELRMGIVIVSHYLGLAREFADRALLLDRELSQVVSGTPREVLEHELFRKRYGEPTSVSYS
jgi:zinc transport system ATP-binding protein